MKIVVTHSSPDMDAIASVWLIKKFLAGWESAIVKFVPAGERLGGAEAAHENFLVRDAKKASPSNRFKNPASSHDENFVGSPRQVIDDINGNEAIHVDTGLGPLDHHQTADDNVCGASRTFDFIKSSIQNSSIRQVQDRIQNKKWKDKMEAVGRMVKVIVDVDHFKEVFRKDPLADYHEFDLASILDGIKLQFPNQDDYYIESISKCLDAVLHEFENRIWAEKEIKENGIKFETRFGKGMGFETINDSVIKLSQKMGYVIVIRKDPRKGYVRIKALPNKARGPVTTFPPASAPLVSLRAERVRAVGSLSSRATPRSEDRKSSRAAEGVGVDLTLAYEKLKKMDSSATWFLHVGKKMLLNGSVKNPKMRPTTLSLEKIIEVLKKV